MGTRGRFEVIFERIEVIGFRVLLFLIRYAHITLKYMLTVNSIFIKQ